MSGDRFLKGKADGSLTISRRGATVDAQEKAMWNRTVVALSFTGRLDSDMDIGYSQGDQPDLDSFVVKKDGEEGTYTRIYILYV